MTEDIQRVLYQSVWRDRPDDLKNLLSEGVSATTVYANNRNLLHVAAWFNRSDMIEPLVKHGASFQNEDATGATPLLLAVQNGSLSAFKALVFQGADLDQALKSKTTALHELAKLGRWEWFEWIAAHRRDTIWSDVCDGHGSSLAHTAAQHQQWKALSWLYSHGCSPDALDPSGQTVRDVLRKTPGGARWANAGPGPKRPQVSTPEAVSTQTAPQS